MKKEKHTVALIFGGRGYEHDVSVEGAKFLYSLIDRELYDTLPVYISRSGEWLAPTKPCEDISRLVLGKICTVGVTPTCKNGTGGVLFPSRQDSGEFIKICAAIPLLHGDFGEDGIVQGALENARIPFVGCDTSAGAILSDKVYTKIVAEHLGVPTVPWVTAIGKSTAEARALAESGIGYPIFIKPSRLGSSIGAALAKDVESFNTAYELAKEVGNEKVLIEKYIEVEKELECAYFRGKSKELFTKPGEISTNRDFYDYSTKYEINAAAVLDCAEVSEDIQKQINEYSRALVEFFGIRDLSRIDFFLARDGTLYFNEINTFPGFTEHSLYPRLLSLAGVNPRELVSELISRARERGA